MTGYPPEHLQGCENSFLGRKEKGKNKYVNLFRELSFLFSLSIFYDSCLSEDFAVGKYLGIRPHTSQYQINIFSLQSLYFSLDADISHIILHRQVSGLISLNQGL